VSLSPHVHDMFHDMFVSEDILDFLRNPGDGDANCLIAVLFRVASPISRGLDTPEHVHTRKTHVNRRFLNGFLADSDFSLKLICFTICLFSKS
jgi:hypothetical protein